MDHAEHRLAALDQRDIDGELAVAADEFLGAVERVDEPEEIRRRTGQAVGLALLLGDDRDAGRGGGERGEDDRLGALIGKRHRRGIRLAADREIAGIDLHDRIAGAPRRVEADREEAFKIEGH